QTPPGGGRRGDAGEEPGAAPPGARARGRVLRVVVSVPLAGLELLAQVRGVRDPGPAPARRGARGPASGARRVPRHGALRAQARVPPGRAVPVGGRRGRAVRHGGRVRASAVALATRSRRRPPRRGARRSFLPPGARAGARQVPGAAPQRGHPSVPSGAGDAGGRTPVAGEGHGGAGVTVIRRYVVRKGGPRPLHSYNV